MTFEEGRRSTRILAKEKDKKKEPVEIPDERPIKIVGPKKNKAACAPEKIDGEEAETEQLEILDEDPLDYSANNNILPVRTLEDFYFYDAMSGMKLVSLDEVGADNRDVCAIGKVKAGSDEYDDDEPEEEDEGDEYGDDSAFKDLSKQEAKAEEMSQVVRLSSIFYWEIKHTPCGSSMIWIRTTFAWYKLLYPNPEYARFYINILKRTRLANIVLNCMTNNPNITYEEFLRDLPAIAEQCSAFPNSGPIKIRSNDLLRYIPYIRDEVQAHVEVNDAWDLLSVPLFTKLIETPDDEFDLPENEGRQRTRRTVRKATSSNEDKTTPPVFTPTISKLASGFIQYTSALDKPDQESNKEEIEEQEAKTEQLHAALLKDLNFGRPTKETVVWKGDVSTSLNSKKIYDAATIGNATIKAGDFIIINDSLSRANRLIRVCHLFQDADKTKKVLGRAFLPGRDTLMGELAIYNELFLTDIIQAYPLSQFVSECEVTHATSEQDESEFAGRFFFRYFYEIETGGYVDARCAINKGWATRLYAPPLNRPIVKDGTIQARSFNYLPHDFVYVIPTNKDCPYEIAQILPSEKTGKPHFTKTSEGDVLVRVRYYKRHEEPVDAIALGTKYGPKKYVPDPRHLYRTNKFTMLDVNRLEGVCYVKHRDDIEDLDKYRYQNDCFYVTSTEPDEDDMEEGNGKKTIPLAKSEHTFNEAREEERLKEMKRVEFARANHKPLNALDIFSGCGGLSLGMKRSGIVQTKYSVEFNCGAATTYKKNFPGATVYNQCANMLLKRAIQTSENESIPNAKDFMGQPLAAMPQPGDVDLIYCGPPCQGFSGINRFKKANDIKNSLIATTLSYVDFYRPKYFMLENVRGLLNFRLGGSQTGINRVEGGIKMGYVKFIMRCLTHMGYQVRISIQQAGNFGLAQSRRRVIIWGTHLGLKLPDYPQPTHCFNRSGSVSLPLPHSANYVSSDRSNNCAPHPAVTIYEAIADLEGFEYRNPCKVYANDPATEENVIQRFPRLPVQGRPFVGKIKADYVQPPFSEFQRIMRSEAEVCHNHVTRPFNDITIERICRVHMTPGSDHSSLPEKLKPWCLSHKDSAADRHNGWKGLFGRLDFKGHFLTALTDIQPMGKQGTVLHPSQRRVLSVRECARAQGFPDDFIFSSYNPEDTKDMHRQVGNAVPPPLANALASRLVLALAENLQADAQGPEEELTNLDQIFDQALDTRLASLAISGPSGANGQPKRSRKPANNVDGSQPLITDVMPAPSLRPRRQTKSLKELSEDDSDDEDFYQPKPTSTRGVLNGDAKKAQPTVGNGKKQAVIVEIPSSKVRYVSNNVNGDSKVVEPDAMED